MELSMKESADQGPVGLKWLKRGLRQSELRHWKVLLRPSIQTGLNIFISDGR